MVALPSHHPCKPSHCPARGRDYGWMWQGTSLGPAAVSGPGASPCPRKSLSAFSWQETVRKCKNWVICSQDRGTGDAWDEGLQPSQWGHPDLPQKWAVTWGQAGTTQREQAAATTQPLVRGLVLGPASVLGAHVSCTTCVLHRVRGTWKQGRLHHQEHREKMGRAKPQAQQEGWAWCWVTPGWLRPGWHVGSLLHVAKPSAAPTLPAHALTGWVTQPDTAQGLLGWSGWEKERQRAQKQVFLEKWRKHIRETKRKRKN